MLDEDQPEAENAQKRAIGRRLQSLHEGESRLSFARKLGVSDSTLGNYERGDRYPDASFLAQLRARAGVDLNWLLEDPSSGSGGFLIHAIEHNLVSLPRFEVRPSAGAGALVISENVAEHFMVGRDWLRRNLPGWAPANATVGILEGSGDSMEPTIRDGDLLMLVRNVEWRIVERGGIFVFTLDDRLLLKRLQVLDNGDLRIISDNRAYEPMTVRMDDIRHRLILHGYVFFLGGKPRAY